MIRRSFFLASLALVTLLVIPGCGYRFGVEGPGPMMGSGEPVSKGPVVKLAIDPLENRTFEPNLELKYSHYLRQEFRISSGAKVVEKVGDADFLLNGAIESVSLPSLTFTENQTQESRVSVRVKVEVKNRRTGKVLWVQTANGTAEFFVSASPETGGGQSGLQFNRILQNRALEQAGQFVAEDLSDRFLFAREQGVFQVSSTKKTEPVREQSPELDLRPIDPTSPPVQEEQ